MLQRNQKVKKMQKMIPMSDMRQFVQKKTWKWAKLSKITLTFWDHQFSREKHIQGTSVSFKFTCFRAKLKRVFTDLLNCFQKRTPRGIHADQFRSTSNFHVSATNANDAVRTCHDDSINDTRSTNYNDSPANDDAAAVLLRSTVSTEWVKPLRFISCSSLF